MIVITQNTAAMFRQELEICRKHNESWRCLIFKFSTLNIRPDNWFSFVLDTVSQCLGEDGARAFHFENGDVHFLLKFATQKAFVKIIELLSHGIKTDISNISFIYEVKIDWDIIIQSLTGNPSGKDAQPNDQPGASPKPLSPYSVDFSKLIPSIDIRRSRRDAPGILVIEDDLFTLRLVQKTLADDFQLFLAEDGEGGYESYIINAPDVLFLDIGLPDTNGLELMEKIIKADPKAYIIILSGNGNRENVLKAIERGAKGFIAKPFGREKLFHYIEKSPFIQRKIVKVY